MRDRAYLEWIKGLLCVVCFRSCWQEALERGEVWRMGREYNCYTRMDAATEAHHAGARGLSQKASDRTAIPLCATVHHREGEHSVHVLGKAFWKFHGIDRDQLIAELNRRYAAEREAA